MSSPATATAHFADPPDLWECGLQVTNHPRAVRVARCTVRTALLAFGLPQQAAETAELLTSELVTNAVKYADGPVYVRARAREGIVRVSVWDDHPELPEPLPLSTTESFGRGLFLVHCLSRSWGQYPLQPAPAAGDAAAGGKISWFELAI